MEFTPDGPMAIPLWINGRAYLTVGDSFFDVVNPVSGQAQHRVPMCGASEALTAVTAAQAAQPGWAAMGLPARQVCLEQLADALARYAGHFAKLLRQDVGFDEARATAEVSEAVTGLRRTSVGDNGVVGLVVDASQPLCGLVDMLVPALLAGATIVIKPSPKAPSAAYALCELATRADWPAGVLNVLHGDTAAIEGLCAAGIDRLLYAGQAALGVQVGGLADAAQVPFEMKAG
ncbi:MAG: aldehyde dehydrogenase family protein [Dechloromonas sp.]|nr:aldehyde dehydrogenase family protein [Dechloromonas sp.]